MVSFCDSRRNHREISGGIPEWILEIISEGWSFKGTVQGAPVDISYVTLSGIPEEALGRIPG